MKTKTKKRINISIPQDVYKKLSDLAKKDQRTIVATLRVLLTK